jgi:hypothetical protein
MRGVRMHGGIEDADGGDEGEALGVDDVDEVLVRALLLRMPKRTVIRPFMLWNGRGGCILQILRETIELVILEYIV